MGMKKGKNGKSWKLICLVMSLVIVLPMLTIFPLVSATSCGFTLKWSTNLDNYYPIGWGPGADDYCYSSNVPLVTADVIGDSWQEIFVCIGYDDDIRDPPLLKNEGTVYALNPHTGVPLWYYNCDDFGSHTCMSLHDLDNDGDLELLCTGYHNITAFHAENGVILWNKNYPNNREDKPALVIKDKGTTWVYTTQDRYYNNQKTIQKRWAINGTIAKEAAYPGPIHPCHGGLSCADINNDGKLEIISSDRNYGTDALGLSCWSLDLTMLWDQPGIQCSTSCGVIYDFNNDGYLDIIVEGYKSMYIINGNTGIKIKGGSVLGLPYDEVYTPAVYDIDNDGHLEAINVMGWSDTTARVFDLNTWTIEAKLTRWDDGNYGLGRAPVIANVYGDTNMEMVFCTHIGWQLMDGTHGNYQTIAHQDDGYDGRADRMVIQDIDNDGKNEIIALMHYGNGYGYNSFNYVRCYDTNGDAPSPPISSKDFLYTYRRLALDGSYSYYDPDSSTSQTYTITVNTQGNGTVTKNPNKTNYNQGETVTLTATADTGWKFKQWSGDITSIQNPTSLTINGNMLITAIFVKNNAYPEIKNITMTTSSPIDTDPTLGWVNITCAITDKTEVTDVEIHIKKPDGSWSSTNMNKKDANNYYYQSSTNFSQYGDYCYYISTTSITDNNNNSENYIFSIAPNWDINSDGLCNIIDYIQISNHYGESGDKGWIREDLDNNGKIDLTDVNIISDYYGKIWQT
jgi:hypothetical protein